MWGRRLRSARFLLYADRMLYLFVAPAPFEDWGEHPYDGTNLSQLLAMLIVVVSVGSLALTVCLSLVTILVGEPLGNPFGAGTVFPPTPLAVDSGHIMATA
jgi:hypothetical protein